MSSDLARAARAHAIFSEILDLAPEQQPALLDELCVGDPALRAWVEALLRADSTTHRLLDAQPAFAALLDGDDDANAGRMIGPYRVIREIGRGGMGVVYLAERDDGEFRQQVALKVVRSGPDTEALAERFLHERQILAGLKHSNIAMLYDGGRSPEGLPFLAMEYVEGERIDRYCERMRLSVEERLRLFIAVCDAVQHAHQNLVVHRDLKPSNVLVTPDGAVKLLDFGIAKLLSDNERDAPEQTQLNAFTPRYSSPEQIRRGLITTSSDVYALGVILFELLTGRTPFSDNGDSFEAARAAIEEIPPKPGSIATRIDGRRIDGDLDAIVLRALQKNPADRYTSASSFAGDVRHWLRREPVSARPDTTLYRVRLFLKRRAVPVAAAAFTVMTLSGFAVFHTTRVTRERNRAEVEARKAAEVRDFLLGMFTSSLPEQSLGDTLRVRDLLERGLASADSLDGQPELRALLLTTLGDVYRALGRYDDARQLLEEAVELYRAMPDGPPLDLAAALTSTAMLHFDLKQYDHAIAPTREALEIQRNNLGHDHPDALSSLGNLATLTARAGNSDEALEMHREILERRRRLFGPDDLSVGMTLNNIGHLLYQQERYGDAETYFRQALDLRRRLLPPAHPDLLLSMSNLASLYREVGNLDAAESLYGEVLERRQEVYGAGHPRMAVSHYNFAQLLEMRGDLAGAEQHFRLALDIDRIAYGPLHPEVAVDSYQLALVLSRQDNCTDAEPLLRSAAEIYSAVDQLRTDRLANVRIALGECLIRLQKIPEARRSLRAAVAAATAADPPDAALAARARALLADLQ